jgi:acyl-homoserine-lactone acylase
MSSPVRVLTFAALASALAPLTIGAQARKYDATIRWTSYGIPHVKAGNWGSLGYGFAYATAEDAACTIARDVAMVNGELSRHFGAADGNEASDVFHRVLLDSAAVHRYAKAQSATSRQFAQGYVAGYNRWLSDHRATMPAACANAAWVRNMTVADVDRLSIGVGIRYGVGRFLREMSSASPPGMRSTDTDLSTNFDLPSGEGSNAVAMGRDITASGRGLLLGNPHYPWQGSSRFHLIHTTIPGQLDVMGVSLYTTTRVSIGFNEHVAWTHTVSTGTRSTVYALDLDPESATRYRYGKTWRALEARTVTVPVKQADGSLRDNAHTVWFSHYGPVIVSQQLPWTKSRAYAVRDVNLENDRSAATYDALNRARSVDEVDAAISLQGTSWVNTIAADRNGTAFYGDVSTVPNVDSAMLARCRTRVMGVPATVILLNGSDPACEWTVDPRSAVPGAMAPQQMPRLKRTDVVSNANDSYWLTNPAAPLEGFSPVIGAERTPRSLRTRAGLAFIDEAVRGGKKATPETLQQMLFSQRNFGAELLLDDVLAVCKASPDTLSMVRLPVDVTAACTVLQAWDRTERIDSRGAQLWREFWRDPSMRTVANRVPFDTADAAHTPRGIATGSPIARDQIRRALFSAQRRLQNAGVAIDATLGEIQFTTRGSERIPIPGGDGITGMWSVISAELKPGGYSPILAGNSYIQVVSWTAAGKLDARGIVTYSQSDNPDSPHSADMTRLYSKGQWITLPFYEQDIRADRQLRTLRLRQ